MTFSHGEVPYSLVEILIAAYTRSTDEYGTPLSLEADQIFEVDPQADTDQMRDSGGVARFLSVKTHATTRIQGGGMSFAALGVMIGAVETDNSSSTPNLVRTLSKRNAGLILPYFGAIGVAPSDDGSLLVCGLRAVMLDKEPKFTFDGTSNKFNVAEMAGNAASIGGVVDHWKSYETLALWTANKPASGAEFLAWFS